MITKKAWFVFLDLLCISTFIYSQSQIIKVPNDFATIQGGIDAANEGDTVLVSEGEYRENIDFKGKAITVASEYILDNDTAHISNTTIFGGQPVDGSKASCVSFLSGEDTTSILNGFTLSGGTGSFYERDVRVRGGGGIFIKSGATIINNYITDNYIIWEGNQMHGAGIYVDSEYPRTETKKTVIIMNNRFTGNILSGRNKVTGGAIAVYGNVNVKIINNFFDGNRAEADDPYRDNPGGGAIFCEDQDILVLKNVFSNNQAPFGGAINARGDVKGNNIKIINNTFAGNSALLKGGALYVYAGKCVTINSIFWDNTAPEDPDIFYRGEFDISYSIVQDSLPGDMVLVADPLFENNSFHLSSGSPAVDAGNPDEVFNDTENSEDPGNPEYPALGGLRADLGAHGGNIRANMEMTNFSLPERFLVKEFNGIHYRLAFPLDYDSSMVYPLTILLHGGAAGGTDNTAQLFLGLNWRVNAEFFGYNEFTIVPQAPTSGGWTGSDNLTGLFELIQSFMHSYPVDSTRIVITGWSIGGGAVKSILGLHPDFFAAGIPVSGVSTSIGDIKHIPMWLFHGSDDSFSPDISQTVVDMYEKTGITAVYPESISKEELNQAIENNQRLFFSRIEGVGHEITKYAYDNYYLFKWLNNLRRPLIKPENATINKTFISGSDSVLFTTSYSNPLNSAFTKMLKLENFDKEFIKNITLYDDGLHGDSEAMDGIWGNYISQVDEKDFYRLGIEVEDLSTDKSFDFNDLSTFTTVNPVTLDHFEIISGELIPGNTSQSKLYFINTDETDIDYMVQIQLIPLDSCIIANYRYFTIAGIKSGEVKAPSTIIKTTLSGDCETVQDLFALNMSIYNYHFWTDTLTMDDLTSINQELPRAPAVEHKQNYPNPFSESTVISYRLPVNTKVSLEVYDFMGRQVKTLVHEFQPSGDHSVVFRSKELPNGMYFYKLSAGSVEKWRMMSLVK